MTPPPAARVWERGGTWGRGVGVGLSGAGEREEHYVGYARYGWARVGGSGGATGAGGVDIAGSGRGEERRRSEKNSIGEKGRTGSSERTHAWLITALNENFGSGYRFW